MSLTTLGAQLLASATSVTYAAPLPTPVGTLLLIENEVLVQGTVNVVARGASGTVDVTHANSTPVYEVVHVYHTGEYISVYYINDAGEVVEKSISAGATEVLLPDSSSYADPNVLFGGSGAPHWDIPDVIGDGTHALPTALTDSTGKVASATTLIVSRTDTVANAVADIQTNIATLNLLIVKLQAYVAGLRIVAD